jgi:hypothetical protein
LTGQEVLWVETVELVGEELFHLNSAQFGCVAVVQGITFNCSEDFGDIFVAAGDTVLLTSAGIADYLLRTTVTTETFLNTAVYEIVGTPITQSVPEPGYGPAGGAGRPDRLAGHPWSADRFSGPGFPTGLSSAPSLPASTPLPRPPPRCPTPPG